MPENDPAIDFPFQKPECNRARKLWNVSLRRKSNKEGEIKYLSTRNRSMNKDKLARTPARASARASAHVVLGKFPPCSLTLRNSTHMHQNTATLLAIILVTSSAYATTRFSTNSHVRSLRLIPASLLSVVESAKCFRSVFDASVSFIQAIARMKQEQGP